MRDASYATLIFQSETELDQGLYFIVQNFNIRVLVMSLDDKKRDPFQRLKNLRPVPTAFAVFGTSQELSSLLNMAAKEKLLK